MAERRLIEEIIRSIPILLIAVCVIIYLLIFAFRPAQPDNYYFVAIGLENTTLNNSAYTDMYYECVKFCSGKFYDNFNSREQCYRQCDKILDGD